MTDAARRAVEQAARESYGRLVAFLAARSRDLAASEDALADAFRAALETWPKTGVPARPEAWLLTAARRRLTDGHRHARVRLEALPTLTVVAEEAQEMAGADVPFPDDRLKLMFVCAHPAIDAGARTPLMLQTVLGLDAVRIASAFLVQPAAMGQRLSRAKAKIRDARIAFETPQPKDLPARFNAVLDAVYAAYGSGWDDVAGADPKRKGLALEAIELGRVLNGLLPADPEVKGLLALMLHCEARRPARRSGDGEYVPLSDQDVALWTWPMVREAEALLSAAQRAGDVGRFQLEAAIQSEHARRAAAGTTDWAMIARLYRVLVRVSPTVGAAVGHAAALAEAGDAADALARLDAFAQATVERYQPYWALRAHLLRRLGQEADALNAYSRAIGLCEDPATRAFLMRAQGR